ncbi:glycoside hydrolase family 76 protein [Xylariaceae sp. FL1272]|nr:glycoside hydrolase family 76 protein [Xylariaceae sp. FL1272]
MVSPSYLSRLVSRAAFVKSTHKTFFDQATYISHTVDAIDSLQQWYSPASGLWATTGWWNAGNCLTVLADYAVLQPASATTLGIQSVMQKTFEDAQKTIVTATKFYNGVGLPISSYSMVAQEESDISKRGFDNFLNDYYDDEGWWALALIRSYDAIGDQTFLDGAVTIFNDMSQGESPCGGIYWSKVDDYTNAIANELYFKVAASLANRVPSQKAHYLNIAEKQWAWFKNSGMINSQNLINDGLTTSCKSNGQNTWTYNQGVILGGLVELYKANGDSTLLSKATAIATAAITFKTKNGILFEGCEPDCGSDGAQFKGVFMRNLRELHQVAPQDTFKNFLLTNADSIWNKDRKGDLLGLSWTGPYDTATAGTQSSAIDALVAAVAIS